MTVGDPFRGVPDGAGEAKRKAAPSAAWRREVLCLGAVLLVALVPRLLYAHFGPHVPVWADQDGYLLTGRYLAGLVEPTDRVVARATDYMNLRGPAYPAFLAIVFRLGGEDVAVPRYVQAVLAALTCGLIYLVARHLASRSVGVVAALLAGVYPTLIIIPGRLLTENFAIPMLCLALLLLVHGLSKRSLTWLLLAGLVAAVTGLSRPTLLAVLPFLVLSVFIAPRGVSFARRLFLAGAYALTITTLILAWRFLGPEPATGDRLLGARGIQLVVDGFKIPTHPSFRGWFLDADPVQEPGEPWWQERSAGYAAAAVMDLVFCHLWYPDTSWVGAYFVPHDLFSVAQRVLIIFAIGGFALSLAKWRNWVPLLLLSCPIAVSWVKWIELRHALPGVPLACIFAALFIVTISTCVFQCGAARKKVAVVLGAAALSAVALLMTRPLFLGALLPGLHPLTLGTVHDAVILILPFAWAVIVMWLTQPRLGWTRAVFAGPVAAVLSTALFAAHMSVGSDPRWHRWEINLAKASTPIVQEIELPEPLVADEIGSASWLVDLELSPEVPPLRVGVNSVWLPTDDPHTSFTPLIFETATERYLAIYKKVSGYVDRELSSWPQWWQIPVDPTAIAGRRTVSCMLAYDPPASTNDSRAPLYLGGGLAGRAENTIHMPSLRRSLYRWPVMRDWRLHELRTLASVRARAYFKQDEAAAARMGVPAVPRALPVLLDSGFAQVNIRLLIEFKDGRSRLY